MSFKLTPSTLERLTSKYFPSESDRVNDYLTMVCNNVAAEILGDMGYHPEDDMSDEHTQLSDHMWKKILEDLAI